MTQLLSQVRGLTIVIAVLLFALVSVHLSTTSTVAAQDGETPEENRSGRLGGSLTEIQDAHGEPDWVDAGLIGYNSLSLADVGTIVVVYYDADEVVTNLSLVYLEKPQELEEPDTVAAVVAEVTPLDGECETEPLAESGLGTQVFACASESLENLFTVEELEALGVKGENGSYSYSVDPTVDGYYEIIVQFGTDSVVVTPTPVPTAPPPPTPTPSLENQYPPVADVRELAIGRGYAVGDQLSVSGTIFTITVDSTGTFMQLWVLAPDGSEEAVIVAYTGDTTGLFEGSFVTAYGSYTGPLCGTNSFGAEICQPAILAVELLY